MPRTQPPSKRKFNWRLSLRIIAWGTLLACVAFAARAADSFLLHDKRFGMGSLELRGMVYASRARLRSVFDADFGRSVFDIPLAERRRHLLAIDWVNTASVSRIWPDKVIVTITERQPVAFARLPMGSQISRGPSRYRLAMIDGEGVLLSVPPRVRFRLPVLSGVTENQTEAERKVKVAAMQHLIEDIGPQAKDISEVNVVSPSDLRIVTAIRGRAVELWIGDKHYRDRYNLFLSHYPEIRAHSQEANIFDLRMEDRILAR